MLNIKKIPKVITLIFIIVLMFIGCSNNNEMLTKNFEKIKIGMSKSEVINILGKPIKINEFEKDSLHYIRFIYEPPSRVSSTFPSVLISKKTGKVIDVVKDDSD